MDLTGKKVLVVGLGASGRAAAELCLARGARVTATDQALEPPGAEELARAGVLLHLGGHQPDDFTSADMVVLSPGVDPRLAEVKAARTAGVEVIGEFELGRRFAPVPAVMITGTNGKSTVTTLVGEMLAADGKRVFVGGNLGTPLCRLALETGPVDWAVLEVSSFQTDTATDLRPEVCAVLNITPDHMDRYESFTQYASSKMSLAAGQGPDQVAVLCVDDAEVASRAGAAGGAVWAYGAAGPLEPGGWLDGDDLVLALPEGTYRFSAAKSPLAGRVWRLNLLAAALCSLACGSGVDAVQAVVDGFAGLEHRMQVVAERDGILYIDDSKATNVGAVRAALAGLGRRAVLLLGGRDKAGRFADLAPQLAETVSLAVCFGEAGPAIASQIEGMVALTVAPGLAEAVDAARAAARPGQAVLLSPGCASFDAYRGYDHRGRHFAELVGGAS